MFDILQLLAQSHNKVAELWLNCNIWTSFSSKLFLFIFFFSTSSSLPPTRVNICSLAEPHKGSVGSSVSGFGEDLAQDKSQQRVCGPSALVYNGNTSKNKPDAAESGLLMLTHLEFGR